MAIDHPLQVIDRNSPSYSILLDKRLGKDAPDRLWAIGRQDLISIPKTALFCSKRCSGDAILTAMDQAQKWRDQPDGKYPEKHTRCRFLFKGA